VSSEFIDAIEKHRPAFELQLSFEDINRLVAYHGYVEKHNPLLHLVAPCSAKEFAVRHILESLTLLKHLPPNAKLADVGAGAGLPSIPCVLVREDLKGRLIESKERKARFLGDVTERLGIADRVEVINKQFIETHAGGATHVTCRALDKFTELLPRLVRWARGRSMLLFGGPNIGEILEKDRIRSTAELMPLSERRFLYVVEGSARDLQ
jgi:16S rRNA (guanine527-N7)-methyltransferase